MLILALDLGKFNSFACFFDTDRQKPDFRTIKTNRLHIDSLLTNNKIDLVVMEACGPSGWISDVCQQKGLRTIVCSTNDDAWQWKNTKRKTDKDDALKLARMAMMKMLTPVHVPTVEVRQQRMLIKYRKKLDQQITRVKNGIRSLFASQGIEIDTGKRAWGLGRERIDSFRKSIAQCELGELWKGQLDLELIQLDELTEKMEQVEERLEVIAKDNPHTQRLMTIPGVGRKTAEALVAAIDDPHRFSSGRELSSYLGLVPKQYQSGETDRNGRISKRGPRLMRSLLLQCAWTSLRCNHWSKMTFARIHGGQKTRRKKAGIALARKIAVVAWAMMRDQSEWDSKRLLAKVPSEGESPRVQRSKRRPAGELHAGPPKHAYRGGRKRRTRRGAPHRAPIKT